MVPVVAQTGRQAGRHSGSQCQCQSQCQCESERVLICRRSLFSALLSLGPGLTPAFVRFAAALVSGTKQSRPGNRLNSIRGGEHRQGNAAKRLHDPLRPTPQQRRRRRRRQQIESTTCDRRMLTLQIRRPSSSRLQIPCGLHFLLRAPKQGWSGPADAACVIYSRASGQRRLFQEETDRGGRVLDWRPACSAQSLLPWLLARLSKVGG
ncbi:hypothetical protein IWX49DRAFT_113475 [Phyllosticta citricarpa]